eukprot:TRINITY_DN4645_c0_g1_i1.p2 TRINITY_DN4645_c0_g1~~TRINITY_DN4645_c0_g1_i1.p2  ORF type:complete len:172 (-),score=12.64 TRINITY_DN4645_c0_g1_i1:325-840(-)
MSHQQPTMYGRIVCRGCHITLMYPQGAGSVRCSQCGTITPSHPAPAAPEMAELTCQGCTVRLRYPRSAEHVQCAVCGHINLTRGVGHLQCSGCRQILRYQLGAQSVRCAVCHAITQATGQTGASSSRDIGNNDAIQGGQFDQMVVVQNPPALDEDGKELNSIVIGMKTDMD